MYLKSILIHGFKSFAEKTILEFSAPDPSFKNLPFTAIVGPNGSGKSNIADAVRWALGEQSVKAIRGKKSEDVIFAGSARRSRVALAEVRLTVVNNDRRIPVDEDEIEIARRIYRDGQSEYLLNNRTARLMDIQMLLTRAAFGKEGYSVIGQGQIDAILTASAEERKSFFDEATGVRPLQIKKDQSLKKLEATEENLNQAVLLKEEIDPRLRSLTRQVRRLERREEVERELRTLQTGYYGTLFYGIATEYTKLESRVGMAQEKKNIKAKELEQIEMEMKTLEKEESKPAEFLSIQSEYEKLIGSKQKLRDREFELKRKMLEVKKETATVPTSEIVDILEGIRKEIEALTQQNVGPGLVPGRGRFRVPESHAQHGGGAQGPALQDIERRSHNILSTITSLLSRLKGEESPKDEQGILKELSRIAGDLSGIDTGLERLRTQMQEVGKSAEQKQQQFFAVQKRLTAKQAEIHAVDGELNLAKIEMAKIETRRDDLRAEAGQEMGEDLMRAILRPGKEPSALHHNPDALHPEIQKLKRQLEIIGGVDEETVKEYNEVKERFEFLEHQIADLEGSLKSLTDLLEELEATIRSQFERAFQKINEEFGNYFKILFGGGSAKLARIMEDPKNAKSVNAVKGESEEPFAQKFAISQPKPSILEKFTKKDPYRGVEITATPPGKKLKSIAMLSGGEKAMTSIALLSAILALNPPPFVILDEVDAALDESNSARFASILTELARRTQFIVVTHNRATMHAAEVLYGVTMGDDGVSKILSLKFEEAAATAGS